MDISRLMYNLENLRHQFLGTATGAGLMAINARPSKLLGNAQQQSCDFFGPFPGPARFHLGPSC